MPAGMRAPETAIVMVVLSPSMSSQIRCDSANCRPPKPVPSIFSSRPATDRSRSTCTGRVGIVRYLLGFGFRCVTIDVPVILWHRLQSVTVDLILQIEVCATGFNNHDDADPDVGYH